MRMVQYSPQDWLRGGEQHQNHCQNRQGLRHQTRRASFRSHRKGRAVPIRTEITHFQIITSSTFLLHQGMRLIRMSLLFIFQILEG